MEGRKGGQAAAGARKQDEMMATTAAHIGRVAFLEEVYLRVALDSEPGRQQAAQVTRGTYASTSTVAHFVADTVSYVASILANLTPVSAGTFSASSCQMGANALQCAHQGA